MRIAILSRKGIGEIVDEELARSPLDQRLSRAHPNEEKIPSKVRVIPAHSSYVYNSGRINSITDLVGPYEDVPDYLIVTNKDEQEELLNGLFQKQLIILKNGLYFRRLRYLSDFKVDNIAVFYVTPKKFEMEQAEIKRLREYALEGMVYAFINHTEWKSNKIVYDSDLSRDEATATLGKFGLKKIQ